MLFGDYEKDFCLGYLNNFKDETLTGSESAEETARITRKNELLQDYRAYVDELYNQSMTTEEYDTHYAFLMNMFSEMLLSEPEPTPQEKFEAELKCVLFYLEEDLYYSEKYGESYIQERLLDIAKLKSSIASLTDLQEKILSKQFSFEQMLDEYAVCLEDMKAASPHVFSTFVSSENAK